MTKKLYEMFKKKYPQQRDSFSIYGAYERINLTLKDKCFSNEIEDLITYSEIEEISSKYFRGFYKIKNAREFGLRGIFILFDIDGFKRYQNYFGHSIWIPRFTPLEMEISTGNRGNSLLTNRQRKNYLWFVNDLFEKFKENAVKNI